MNEQAVREGIKKLLILYKYKYYINFRFGPAVGSRKIIDQEYLHAQESL